MLGRTRHVYVTKARDAVVAALEVIIADDAGGLWEALKESGEVESALGVLSEPHPADDKYLKSLAEAYQNAFSWDKPRQVISVMADLVPHSLIQRYLPGITEYQVKTPREHGKKYGRGLAVLLSKSPRMRVNYAQLDHFVEFITSPHVVTLSLAFWPKTTFPGRWKSSRNSKCHKNNDTRANCGTVYAVL